jgi:peptide/nickel transport system permease protein
MATALDITQLGMDELPDRPTGIGSWPGSVWQFCKRKPLGAFGGAIVVALLFVAIFVDARVITLGMSNEPLLAPQHYDKQVFGEENESPSWDHWMGTDRAGRDILSRILYGARISVIIGFTSVFIASTISMLAGSISGFFGGWSDTLFQRLVDVFLAIPAVVLLIFTITVFASRPDGKVGLGPVSVNLGEPAYEIMFWIILIVGVLLGVGTIRVVRGAAISVGANQYIDAARALGASNTRIVVRHVMPNVLPVVIVLASIGIGTAILAEATISFLGYGIPPPFPSWGVMLSSDASNVFREYPLQAVWPGAAIALVVYGFNMFGDALRDVLDPRLRGGR